MPTTCGHLDKSGYYCIWGKQGKKYYYNPDDKASRERARKKANKQGAAARASGYKSKPEEEIIEKSSDVQSLVFSKPKFDKKSAASWAKSHGFKSGNIRDTENTIRLQQFPPENCKEAAGMKELDKGVQAYICIISSQKSTENDEKLPEIGEKESKCADCESKLDEIDEKMPKNDEKVIKSAENLQEMAQNDIKIEENEQNIVKNEEKSTKITQNEPKIGKNEQIIALKEGNFVGYNGKIGKILKEIKHYSYILKMSDGSYEVASEEDIEIATEEDLQKCSECEF